MKKLQLITMVALAAGLAFSGCAYKRMGSLTMASTRNLDPNKHYELLARGVETKVHSSENALQAAIDKAVLSRPGGEYMMNVSISVNGSGTKVKLLGDIWGMPQAEGVAPAVQTGAATDLKVGDKVAVKLPGSSRIVSAVIVGMQVDKALVEYEQETTKGAVKKMKAVEFDRITRL